MSQFNSTSESDRAPGQEANVSNLRFPEKIGLVFRATQLLFPALAEHIVRINEWGQNPEAKFESKWTNYQFQDQLLQLRSQQWPITVRHFLSEPSQSTSAEGNTFYEINSSDDLGTRVIAVRDEVIRYFSDLLKADSPLSDCFKGDTGASEKQFIAARFGQVFEELSSSSSHSGVSDPNLTDAKSEAHINTAAATALVEHTLYGRWANILWEEAGRILLQKTPVYGPPSPLSQLEDIVHQLIGR